MTAVRRRFIAPVSFGLGDLVVSLPVVQAAVNAGRALGHRDLAGGPVA